MAPKKTTNILITIRPRAGINDVEVGMFNKWVGGKSKQLLKYAVVIEKPNTPAQHLHAVLVFIEETNQDNVKRQVVPIFKDLISSDERWENPKIAINVKAHHDPAGCVGGYLEKEDHKVLHCVGFNTEELQAGAKRRDVCVDKKKKLLCNKQNLILLLVAIHEEYYLDGEMEDQDRYGRLSVEEQVELCFRTLIHRGYLNYIHLWSVTLRLNVIKYWILICTHDKA